MKVFIAAILILLLLTGGVIGCGVFLHNRLCVIIDCALRLPDRLIEGENEYGSTMDALCETWDDVQPWVTITVSATRIESIDRAIGNIQAGWDSEDDTAYRQARADLLLLLQRLRATEACSISAVI